MSHILRASLLALLAALTFAGSAQALRPPTS
jgi:hypothetical protein